MKTSEIRKCFLDFFKAKKHTIVKSDSLVPRNDPTLLFTGAGMNQFKDYFLGLRMGLERAASIQKCLRTGDLDQVGKTPYHHSFFEMLGNFSFGDYFKEEAIEWAWEFLTKEVKIPRERLYVSVHQDDKEALRIWVKKIEIPEKLIARLGDDSNFWPADAPKLGPNGPCGPCSEIFFDQGANYPGAGQGFWAEDESGRYAEIWNLVFTQFERQDNGKLAPLKAKNIDTGMGLERLACVLQNVKSNFEIDIFQDIHKGVKFSLGFGERERTKILTDHLYAISDHIRAVVFAMSDGVIPANEGRGYVVRKLIRRALWRGYELLSSSGRQLKEPFLYKVSSEVVKTMKDVYPELEVAGSGIRSTLKNEEERFLNTLETGLKLLHGHLSSLKGKTMPGDIVFELYDTYGFPDELTRVIAKKLGKEIDEKGFEALLDEQRRRAKASSKIRDTIFSASDVNQDLLKIPETKFLGYQSLEAEGKILWLSFSGEEGMIVLDQTPFYPEGGGQVGDRGILQNKNFSFSVSDTQKKEKVIVHYGKLTKGKPKIGETGQAEVSQALREATKRNHTATHLLQAALRSVLGAHVRQVGSLVNPEKLRFDFTHGKALTEEEIKKIETWVNEVVLESSVVQATQQNYEQAMRSGTLAFFGDKYGDEVRVVEVLGKSKELCGGTHCHQTGEIGAFVITSETSIGSGTRRIEAITGLNAVRYLKELQKTVSQISSLLRVGADQVTERIEKLQKRVRELEQKGSKREAQKIDVDTLIQSGKTIGSVKLITQTVADETVEFLRQLADQIRTKAKQSVVVLFSTDDSKVNVIIALSKDLAHSTLDAKRLAQEVAPFLEGSAGGRKDLAQGGGRNREGIESALKALSQVLEKTV